MKELLRRVRGALGMGLTWALGWMPIGALVALGLWVVGLDPPGLAAFVWLNVKLFGAFGFVAGSLFSAVLRLREGHRRFDELSLPRFTAWGAVGGLLLGGLAVAAGFWGPGLQLRDAVIVGVATLLGAASAAGTLAVARAAEDEALLQEGAGVEGVGLTENERTQLLGDGS
jgi:hypothetical protein